MEQCQSGDLRCRSVSWIIVYIHDAAEIGPEVPGANHRDCPESRQRGDEDRKDPTVLKSRGVSVERANG